MLRMAVVPVSSKTKSIDLMASVEETPPFPEPSPAALKSMVTWPPLLLAEHPKKCVLLSAVTTFKRGAPAPQ
jgi:hypothetical protein